MKFYYPGDLALPITEKFSGPKSSLTGLRTLSRQGHPNAYLQVLDYAQEYTWRVDFSDYRSALTTLTESGALEEPEGRSTLVLAGEDVRADPKLRLPPRSEAGDDARGLS